jgi:hypothetical protein
VWVFFLIYPCSNYCCDLIFACYSYCSVSFASVLCPRQRDCMKLRARVLVNRQARYYYYHHQ